jgi:carboxylesterase
MNILHERAREFFFLGNKTGLLLIHGFTGTPHELREMGSYLSSKGFTVKGILLKGHGKSLKEMREANHIDWIELAEQGYQELLRHCDEVFVIGFSMGGVLALHLANKYNVKGVVSLSAPIKVLNGQYCIKALIKYLRPVVSKYFSFKRSDIIGCDRTPLKCIISLLKLIGIVKSELNMIDKPILIMQSYRDETVHPSSANIIYKRVASRDKSIIFLHNSGHIITCDCEKEQVFNEVYSFISKRCSKRVEDAQDMYSKTMEV